MLRPSPLQLLFFFSFRAFVNLEQQQTNGPKKSGKCLLRWKIEGHTLRIEPQSQNIFLIFLIAQNQDVWAVQNMISYLHGLIRASNILPHLRAKREGVEGTTPVPPCPSQMHETLGYAVKNSGLYIVIIIIMSAKFTYFAPKDTLL